MSSSIDYESQIHYMMSYAGIRSQVLEAPEEPYTIIKRNYKPKQSKQQVTSLADIYSQDPNVICAIQSEPLLMHILMSYRKQKIPLVYIYVNGSQYLTFIVKVVSYYPVIFIKLPINNFNIYVNPNSPDGYYSFPINHIKFKSISHSMQYQLILRNDAEISIDFITFSNGNPTKTSISNVSIVHKELIGTILSAESIKSINIHNQISDNPITAFNSSIVTMISCVSNLNDLIDFSSKKAGPGTDSRFIIESPTAATPGEKTGIIRYIYSNNHINESSVICTESTALYWEIYIPSNQSREYNLESHDTLFRLNYSKFINGRNKMYYVLLSYLDCYLFVKLIWSGDINTVTLNKQFNHNITYSSIFDKNNQIIEIYMLREIQK